MGREAICTCDWSGEVTEVKALLESGEIVLRGGLRKRIPLAEISHVQVRTDSLCFHAGSEAVQLVLGPAVAARWKEVLTSPLPSLAKKLGITNKTVVRVVGDPLDQNLKGALAEAAGISSHHGDLVVACVDTSASLHSLMELLNVDAASVAPVWVVYAKGPGHPLNESAIRSQFRSHGMMDTKVASVSSSLTALRFNARKGRTPS